MKDFRTVLMQGARQMGIELDQRQVEMFDDYMRLLKEWNRKLNLTSITEENEIAVKHFLDSMTCAATGLISDGQRVIDVGTGAGFPAIPIKILYPDLKVVLLDSLNKRVEFLRTLISGLGLSGIEAYHGRAEELAREDGYREAFDLCLSRAVAHLSVLSEYCVPFISRGGKFFAMKGPSFEEELQEARNAIEILGGKVFDTMEFALPGTDIKHYIVIITKVGNTPSKYPRKAGKPAKNPIK